MLSPKPARRMAIAIGAAVVAIATILFVRGHWNTVYDDALIYLRYVRNLRAGCGVRFNCDGAAVEGFTSPLYLGVLWLGSFVTTQWIAMTQIVGATCVIGAAALAIATAVTLVDEGQPRAILVTGLAVAVALAADPYFLLNGNTGMETALAALVVSLVAFAAARGHRRLLVAAIIVAPLARPECAVLVAALPLVERRWRAWVVIIVALAAVTVVRLAVFGEPLPNTYYAKSGGTWRHAVLGAAYVRDCIVDFPLCVLAIASVRQRWLLVAAGLWLAFFVRTGGDTFSYSRLWLPLVPALTALACVALARLRWYAPAIAAVLAGGRAEVVHHIPDQGTSPRVVEWMAIGTYLREHTPPGTLVATVPIGAIGYYSNRPILDLVGLTDETIARAGRTVPGELLTKNWIGHERHDTEYVLARAPGVIVTTMHRDSPWTLADAKAGFWADWLLLQEIKAGRAPYRVRDAEVMPGDHVLMFERY